MGRTFEIGNDIVLLFHQDLVRLAPLHPGAALLRHDEQETKDPPLFAANRIPNIYCRNKNDEVMGGLSVERARANANAPVVTKATRRPRSSSAPRKRSRSPGPRKKSPGPARGFPEGAGGKTDEEGAGEWGFSLHGIEDVPSQLAFNKFVLKGYRMKLTPAQCLWSMFRLHNETINIWSHTLPILYFVWIFMTDGVWQEAPFSFAIAVKLPAPFPPSTPPTVGVSVISSTLPLSLLAAGISI